MVLYGLTAELFKCLDEESLITLTGLYSKVFSCGHFPQSWAQGLIIPIYKSGSTEDINNY